jgi:hypothetical protein
MLLPLLGGFANNFQVGGGREVLTRLAGDFEGVLAPREDNTATKKLDGTYYRELMPVRGSQTRQAHSGNSSGGRQVKIT